MDARSLPMTMSLPEREAVSARAAAEAAEAAEIHQADAVAVIHYAGFRPGDEPRVEDVRPRESLAGRTRERLDVHHAAAKGHRRHRRRRGIIRRVDGGDDGD